MNQQKPKLVLSTCPDRATGEKIANALVDRGDAACVNIIPGVHSVYRWQGKTESAEEVLLLIKSRGNAFDNICKLVTSLHPYELPEVVAVTIEDGLEPYLAWINNPEN